MLNVGLGPLARCALLLGCITMATVAGCGADASEPEEQPSATIEAAQTATMTGYLTSAAIVAAIDGPLPVGDVIAVGILVVGGISYYVATRPSYDPQRASYQPIQRVRITNPRAAARPVPVPVPTPVVPQPTSTPCPPCPPGYWETHTGHTHWPCMDPNRGHRHWHEYNQNPSSCRCFVRKTEQVQCL